MKNMFEYAFSVLNVWEKKLFNSLDQERMLKSPDRENAFLVLFDTDLGQVAKEKETDIEDVLEKDLILLKQKLAVLLAEKEEFLWYLFLKFDALNIKIALKKQGEPFSFSIEPFAKLEKMILSQAKHDFETINPFVQAIISECAAFLGKDSALIERKVDEAYFKVKLVLAKKIHPFLEEITRLEIDLANAKKPRNIATKIILEREKSAGAGPEKILGFWEKKMNGHANIRLILFAKEKNVDFQEIEKSLLVV